MGTDSILSGGTNGAFNLMSSATEIALLASLGAFCLQKWLFWIGVFLVEKAARPELAEVIGRMAGRGDTPKKMAKKKAVSSVDFLTLD